MYLKIRLCAEPQSSTPGSLPGASPAFELGQLRSLSGEGCCIFSYRMGGIICHFPESTTRDPFPPRRTSSLECLECWGHRDLRRVRLGCPRVFLLLHRAARGVSPCLLLSVTNISPVCTMSHQERFGWTLMLLKCLSSVSFIPLQSPGELAGLDWEAACALLLPPSASCICLSPP